MYSLAFHIRFEPSNICYNINITLNDSFVPWSIYSLYMYLQKQIRTFVIVRKCINRSGNTFQITVPIFTGVHRPARCDGGRRELTTEYVISEIVHSLVDVVGCDSITALHLFSVSNFFGKYFLAWSFWSCLRSYATAPSACIDTIGTDVTGHYRISSRKKMQIRDDGRDAMGPSRPVRSITILNS